MALNGIGPDGNVVGHTDQRSKIGSFNIAPSWTHVLNANAVYTLGAFVRRDDYNYYPSSDPFADLGPTESTEAVRGSVPHAHQRGAADHLSYVKGIHQIKAGATYTQHFSQ